jgi:hypothetical protein
MNAINIYSGEGGAMGPGNRNVVSQVEARLLATEQRIPRHDDRYHLGLGPESPEYRTLADAGSLTPFSIGDGRMREGEYSATREQLVDAGYAFVNSDVHNKPILGGTIPDPHNPGETIELAGRTLLTRPELDTVYEQQAPADHGVDTTTIDEVRTDMLHVMATALSGPAIRDRESGCGIVGMGRFKEWGKDDSVNGSTKEWRAVGRYLRVESARYLEEYTRNHPDSRALTAAEVEIAVTQRFVETHCKDIAPWAEDPIEAGSVRSVVRGVLADVFHRNVGHGVRAIDRDTDFITPGLNYGTRSPFLESGFRAGHDPAIIVTDPSVPPDGAPLGTMSTTSWHVAGGHPDYPGLSGGGPGAQDFMPVSTYVDRLYEPDKSARQELHSAELGKIMSPPGRVGEQLKQRLLEVAGEQHPGIVKGLGKNAAKYLGLRQE